MRSAGVSTLATPALPCRAADRTRCRAPSSPAHSPCANDTDVIVAPPPHTRPPPKKTPGKDGLANEGITSHPKLVEIARGTRERAATTTIGFGEGFDENLLTSIAEASNGNTYFVETPEDAPGIFAEEFEGLATLVAQNMSVEIHPTDDVEMIGVLHDYPTVTVPGGVQVQLGDAYGGERRRVLFRLAIPKLATLGPVRVADVVVRCVGVDDSVTLHELKVPVTVNLVSADEAAAQEADHEVSEELWLLDGLRSRQDAIDHADRGDLLGSLSHLRAGASRLRAAAASSSRPEVLLHEAELLEAHAARREGDDPRLWRKRVHDERWRHNRGRRRPQ